MSEYIDDIAELLKSKGCEKVEVFTNIEGDRVATFENNNNKFLVSIDLL